MVAFSELCTKLPSLKELNGFEERYASLPGHAKGIVNEYVEMEVAKKEKPGYDEGKAKARMEKMVAMLEKRKEEDMEGACCAM